jgi:energy-coupling factor transporter ATP-binding protein EcfA2
MHDIDDLPKAPGVQQAPAIQQVTGLQQAPARGESLFLITGAEFRYGRDLALALGGLALAEGETVALLGPNGCGKTTLLKALNGLLGPTAGRVLFKGVEASSSAELRARSVYLHQHPYLLTGTVAYNLRFGCRAAGLDRGGAEARCAELEALLGLSDFGRRRHRELSGGEAQRVALARALATGADVLLLDEPTASADAASRDLILSALRARRDATIVFSTHDAALAAGLADRVLSLERGLIVDDRRFPR